MSKILVVDSDICQLANVSAALSEDGLWTELVKSPEVVEDIVLREGICLVIVALNMPFMSGVELMDKIHLHHPYLPFFIVSEIQDQELILNIYEWGAKEFIASPINLQQLLDLAKKQVSQTIP